MTMTPCLECGEPSNGPRCDEHRRPAASRPSRAAGYDTAWDRLSRRARKLQPFCSDCGTRDDLTTDHSPEAWKRKERGLAIRLEDVSVVCRACNSRRGAARTRGEGADKSQAGAYDKSECETLFENDSRLGGAEA